MQPLTTAVWEFPAEGDDEDVKQFKDRSLFLFLSNPSCFFFDFSKIGRFFWTSHLQGQGSKRNRLVVDHPGLIPHCDTGESPPFFSGGSLWEALSDVSQKWIPFPTALKRKGFPWPYHFSMIKVTP